MPDGERISALETSARVHLSMKPPTFVHPQRRFTSGQVALLGVATAVAALLVLLVSVFQFFSNPSLNYACSMPGEHALAHREEFVRAHLDDASRFEVATYDCEDGGSAHLAFQTSLEPSAARDALLSDSACQPYRSSEGDDTGIVCGTGSSASIVYFDKASDGATSGELHLSG